MDRKDIEEEKYSWLTTGFSLLSDSKIVISTNSSFLNIATDDEWMLSFEKKLNKKPTDQTCKIYQCGNKFDFHGPGFSKTVCDVENFEKWRAELPLSCQSMLVDTEPPMSFWDIDAEGIGLDDLKIDDLTLRDLKPPIGDVLKEPKGPWEYGTAFKCDKKPTGDDCSVLNDKPMSKLTSVGCKYVSKKKFDKFAHIKSPVGEYIRGGALQSFNNLNKRSAIKSDNLSNACKTRRRLFVKFNKSAP